MDYGLRRHDQTYYNCKNDCSKVTLNKIKIYDICLMNCLARERKYGLISRNIHLDWLKYIPIW